MVDPFEVRNEILSSMWGGKILKFNNRNDLDARVRTATAYAAEIYYSTL